MTNLQKARTHHLRRQAMWDSIKPLREGKPTIVTLGNYQIHAQPILREMNWASESVNWVSDVLFLVIIKERGRSKLALAQITYIDNEKGYFSLFATYAQSGSTSHKAGFRSLDYKFHSKNILGIVYLNSTQEPSSLEWINECIKAAKTTLDNLSKPPQ